MTSDEYPNPYSPLSNWGNNLKNFGFGGIRESTGADMRCGDRDGFSHSVHVPAAEGLVVRVVSSVDKKLEVKSRFLEVLKTIRWSSHINQRYLSMLRKAAKEKIIVDPTNLFDHFFFSTGECKAKITTARLPYFDGDYWPGAAEDMIYQLQQEEDGRKHHKGTMKKTISKRALEASGQSDLSGNATKDILLMHK